MSVDPRLAVEQAAAAAVPMVDARGARGIQAGSFNTQINYYYGEQTWAAQPTTLPLTDSPYRGLSAFEAKDEQLFFGRDQAIGQVLGRLSQALDGPGLVVLSGASGAGKSSLLRAGVLPRLRRDGLTGAAGSAGWPCLLLTPGQAPVDELAVQVASLAGTDAGLVQRSLAAHPEGFAFTARQAALARQDGGAGAQRGRLLLVIDQFEQLFTVCQDERQRRAFITALHSAATARQGPEPGAAALVVLGVRADFEARCADYPELTAAVQDRYLLTAMTERQLRIAITAPAARAGSGVDAELTDLLLREISTRPPGPGHDGPGHDGLGPAAAGALPLLSHALDQAWRNRAGSTLTMGDYERTGGIETAVARSAEQAYGALSPAQQATARRLFTRLTATGPDGTDTAVPAATADLAECSTTGQFSDVEAVLNAFAGQRLLTLAAGTVEITHEVLLTAWPLLRDEWLADTRADRMVRTRLAVAAAEWLNHSRDPAYLYGGTVLETARAAAARSTADPARHPPLARDEQAFLAASDRARRRRAQRRQALIATLTALTVTLAAVAAGAIYERGAAISGRNLAASDALAAESLGTGSSDPVLARLEAVAAWHLDPTPRADYAMLSAAALPEDAVFKSPNTGLPVTGMTYSPDGKTLAITSQGGGIQLWDVPGRHTITAPAANNDFSAAFSPNGKTLAVGTETGAQLWNARSRDLIGQLPGSGDDLSGNVTFSPDGALLAVGYDSGPAPVQLWDVASRRLITTFPAYGRAVAFSPDGKILAMGTEGGAQLWDVSSRRMVASVQFGHLDQVTALAFSPNGKILAISVGGGPTRLWAVASHRVVATLPQGTANAEVTAMRFNPGGTILAVAATPTSGVEHGPSVTRLWAVPAGRLITTLPNGGGTQVDAMAFNPDGTTLATGDYDGSTQVWNVAAVTNTPSAVLTYDSDGAAPALAFSPDGATLAAGTGNAVQLWNVAAGRRTGTLLVGRGQQTAYEVFSPDGATLAVRTGNAVQLWNVAARRLIKTLPGTGGSGSIIAFSPDGATLAVGTGNVVKLWNVATSRIIKVLPLGRGQDLSSVAFSPDGALLAVGALISNTINDSNPTTQTSETQLWDVAAGRLTARLPAGAGFVYAVAFSPDGGTLAVGTGNGTQLWDVAQPAQAADQTPEVLPTKEGAEGEAVAYAPGTDSLAVATSAGIQVWDAATGQEITAHPVGSGNSGTPMAGSPAFSARGTLAVATGGGRIQLWSMPYLSRATSYLCGLAGRSFTQDEWTQDASGLAYQATCP